MKAIQIIRAIFFIPIGIITYPFGVFACTVFGILAIAALIFILFAPVWLLLPRDSEFRKDAIEGLSITGWAFAMPAIFWYCMIRYGKPYAPDK